MASGRLGSLAGLLLLLGGFGWLLVLSLLSWLGRLSLLLLCGFGWLLALSLLSWLGRLSLLLLRCGLGLLLLLLWLGLLLLLLRLLLLLVFLREGGNNRSRKQEQNCRT
jgi:hypothetical protein